MDQITRVWLYNCQAGRIVMSSNRLMPVETRPRTIEEIPSRSSGNFLKYVSDAHQDKLYDLPENIQDVMGLQALRPSAAVCKVMTVPNSNCVRIVTPDEHVSTGFHEMFTEVTEVYTCLPRLTCSSISPRSDTVVALPG